MLNPFDLKAALAAKHAQHVVLIHFPIALFFAGAAFDFLAHWTKRQGLSAAAYGNFLVAAVATLPTMITGLLACCGRCQHKKPYAKPEKQLISAVKIPSIIKKSLPLCIALPLD